MRTYVFLAGSHAGGGLQVGSAGRPAAAKRRLLARLAHENWPETDGWDELAMAFPASVSRGSGLPGGAPVQYEYGLLRLFSSLAITLYEYETTSATNGHRHKYEVQVRNSYRRNPVASNGHESCISD
eukprot:scaffold190436_cov39-Prasinocladus_malaysianus.AAC.1